MASRPQRSNSYKGMYFSSDSDDDSDEDSTAAVGNSNRGAVSRNNRRASTNNRGKRGQPKDEAVYDDLESGGVNSSDDDFGSGVLLLPVVLGSSATLFV